MIYKVGQLLTEGIENYSEGVKFDFNQDGAILRFAYYNPSKEEINDISKGKFQVAMNVQNEVIFMLFKLGNHNWVDVPYSVHLSKPFEFGSLDEGMGIALHIFLADSSNGILKAMRLVGLPTDFSRTFQKAVMNQKKLDFDKNKYYQTIIFVFDNYTTNDLVANSLIFTLEGDDQELTLKESAELLGHSGSSTLWKAIQKGVFREGEFRIVGNTYLIRKSAIERYRNEHSGKYGFASKNMINPRKKKDTM